MRWRLAAVLTAALCLISPAGARAQESLPGGESGQGEAPTFEQNVCYSIGLSIGRDLMQNKVPVQPDHLVAGIMDALGNRKPRLTDEQIQEVMTKFEQVMQQKAEELMASEGEKNKQEGAAFLAENAKKQGIQTTKSGLQYRVVEPGKGASPTARSTVKCHYEGHLIDGTVFDSSYKRGEPATFPVGGVISGWTEMLQLMKEGGKVEVFIPSDLAYGDRGAPPAIGPGETLVFTIELLEVQ